MSSSNKPTCADCKPRERLTGNGKTISANWQVTVLYPQHPQEEGK